jgi:hypothetical protein
MREEVFREQPQECKSESMYKPSRSECLRDYEVRIKFLSIGCMIEVGCKSIPFTSIKEGMAALNEYVEKPYETRKIWEAKFEKGE